MTKYIHISPRIQEANRLHRQGKTPPPCVIVRRDIAGKDFDECYEAIIYGQDGKEAARIVFRPGDPLPPRITCWIETKGRVELVTEYSGSAG